jgi:hypothetical protein
MKDEELRAQFDSLKNVGLNIDLGRSVASLRLRGRFSFSDNAPEAEPLSIPVLKFDENDTTFFAPFRALTATIIPDRGIDFSNAEMLKASTKMLNKQTVYTNHNTDVGNWVGTVVKSWWDEASNIPAGINVTLGINKKWNEKIIDGIKEGAIHSVSVDVIFDYVKSHPNLDNFWFHLGENIDGSIVRLIVTRISSYGEISLVWQGADIYAKRIDMQASKEPGLGRDNKTGEESMKLSRKQVEALGLTPSDYGFKDGDEARDFDASGTESLFRDAAVKLSSAIASTNALSAALKLAGLNPESSELSKDAEALKNRASAGDAHLSDLRADAIKFAKISEGIEKDGHLNEALEKAINNADAEDAKKFRDDYKKRADEKFPVKCEKCGGSFSRGSAQSGSKETEHDDIDPSDFNL